MCGAKVQRASLKKTGDARGFTLMEMLIAMAIFAIVVVIVSDIFLMSNRSQRKLFGLERTQADARYTLEAIAREVRTGSIDFAYYVSRGSAIATPEAELALRDSTDVPIVFRLSTPATENLCVDANSRPCLLVKVGTNAEQSITPRNVAVRSAKFYISPNIDPQGFDTATGTYAANIQPHVTVSLILESRGERAQEVSVVYLQTTATSRAYYR